MLPAGDPTGLEGANQISQHACIANQLARMQGKVMRDQGLTVSSN